MKLLLLLLASGISINYADENFITYISNNVTLTSHMIEERNDVNVSLACTELANMTSHLPPYQIYWSFIPSTGDGIQPISQGFLKSSGSNASRYTFV